MQALKGPAFCLTTVVPCAAQARASCHFVPGSLQRPTFPASTSTRTPAAVPPDHSSTSSCDSSSTAEQHAGATAATTSDAGLDAFKAFIGERRFLCTLCGKCCTGDGEVWISDAEAVRIAAFLGMPLQRFQRQHTHAHSRVQGFRLLRTRGNEAGDCTFLQPDNTCVIHPVRPVQCSTYPWWPDLVNPRDWQWEKENVCEGFDHPDAPPTDLDDAARQLRTATAQEYQKLLSAKAGRGQRPPAEAAGLQGLQAGPPEAAPGPRPLAPSSSQHGDSRAGATGAAAAQSSNATWQTRLSRLQQQVAPEQPPDG